MHDMGISNHIAKNPYGDCTKNQIECFKFTTGVNKNENYIIKDGQNKIINNSDNLKNLIKKVVWRKFKLVN